jgi:hypothetical protein
MRCPCILLTTREGLRVHMFEYESDIERTDVLYTSVLVQMSDGLAVAAGPHRTSPRAWRRSWLLGFAAAVITGSNAAEAGVQAAAERAAPAAASGRARRWCWPTGPWSSAASCSGSTRSPGHGVASTLAGTR